MAQTKNQRTNVLRATLHAIDEVFWPLSASDSPQRKEPASVKKMKKGDACWATRKRILGWDIDTESSTLHLPPHCFDRLREILTWLLPPNRRLSINKWHQVLGELRSMSPALPGTRGLLFSVLEVGLQHTEHNRVRLTPRIHDLAHDFLALLRSVHNRPTQLQELVPTQPSDVCACNACRLGMGGVWFDELDRTSPPPLYGDNHSPTPYHAISSLPTTPQERSPYRT